MSQLNPITGFKTKTNPDIVYIHLPSSFTNVQLCSETVPIEELFGAKEKTSRMNAQARLHPST